MRVLAAAGLLAVGAGTGLAGVALHDLTWGLALTVAATAFALLALPAGWWTRLPFALGWTLMVAWLVPTRPEGDYALGQDWQGYTMLGAGPAGARHRHRHAAASGGPARAVRRRPHPLLECARD